MSCGKIRRIIEAYVDGAASRPEREAVDAHVVRCAECARALEQSRTLVDLLSAAPRRQVSSGFEVTLRAALEHVAPLSQSVAWWERFRLRFDWRFRMPALVAAGSLATGIIAAVVAPQVIQYQNEQQARRQFIASAVERHKQLERPASNVNWDAIDTTIDLNTADVVTE
jgi:anti-sigma factor RsiW